MGAVDTLDYFLGVVVEQLSRPSVIAILDGCERHRSFVTWAYSPAEVTPPAHNRSQAA